MSEVTMIAVPKFVMDDLGETLGTGNFTSGEQNQFRDGRDQLLATTCREIGWFGQTALLGTTTDYHAPFRHLRFQTFCTGLREHILSLMNLLASALECVDDHYKTPKLIGSESLKDLQEVAEKMREGKINLEDVIQL
ncbi:MAG: hypothetical protein IH867_06940 [Chloroflexi bacterium]|nr:hypothetical protein [Chloroflexota bacterium]